MLLSISVLIIKCSAFAPISSETPSPTPSIEKKETKITKKAPVRTELIEFAEKYKGSKYIYGGMTPKGFDCSGYTCFVMNEFGIKLPHNSGAQSSLGKKISIKNAQQGDLLFFENKGRINHVGLVFSNDKNGLFMIHGSSSRGIVIDNVYENSYWKPRLKYARDVIGE